MCLNTRYIYNPSKFISLNHGDPFRIGVKCGKCAECMRQSHDEWSYRTYYEFRDTVTNGGYVLFDTLTYDDKHIPHVSDYIDIPKSRDFTCFSRSDIRHFFVRLRRRLSYYGWKEPFKYFLTCEYGSPDNTFRPHYHVLFFLPKSIHYTTMCQAIHDSWQKGITDNYFNSVLNGFGWSYAQEHVYDDMSQHGQQVMDYVSKYVEKDSEYQDIIDDRLDDIKACLTYDSAIPEKRTLLRQTLNQIKQFHLQSHFYGLGALSDLDLIDLDKTGNVYLPVPKLQIYKRIPLPLYFQRKLFYELVEVDGKRCWQLTEEGKQYKLRSLVRAAENVKRRFENWLSSIHCYNLTDDDIFMIQKHFESIDLTDFSDYIIYKKGRIKSDIDFATIEQKVKTQDIQFYHYSTMKDIDYFHCRFVSHNYLGNDTLGYSIFPEGLTRTDILTPLQFANLFTWHDSKYDYALALYLACMQYKNQGKQDFFTYNQVLNKKLKYLKSN